MYLNFVLFIENMGQGLEVFWSGREQFCEPLLEELDCVIEWHNRLRMKWIFVLIIVSFDSKRLRDIVHISCLYDLCCAWLNRRFKMKVNLTCSEMVIQFDFFVYWLISKFLIILRGGGDCKQILFFSFPYFLFFPYYFFSLQKNLISYISKEREICVRKAMNTKWKKKNYWAIVPHPMEGGVIEFIYSVDDVKRLLG